jgi:hypothetical protein
MRRGRASPSRRGQRALAALETLIALPLVLLTGLSVLQFGLVLHARQAVMHSATEGARSGAVGHAAPEAIERGLARGLSPWLFGAEGAADHLAAVARTGTHLAQGRAQGWVRWRQLSPTERSFQDWGVPVLDDQGLPIEGTREIPTDNLAARTRTSEPASGGLAEAGGAEDRDLGVVGRVGAASGQTLADANLLKIEFTYGVPLTVPLVGRLGAWVMRVVDGCPSADAAAAPRIALLALGTPPRAANPRPWTCAYYDARRSTGEPSPRWPVRVSATARLQQPARHAGPSPDDAPLPFAPSLGAGEVLDRPSLASLPPTPSPGAIAPTPDRLLISAASQPFAPGFLQLGGNRTWPDPAVCRLP